ncbi:MAG TPA: DinB family protein [Terriglobales bacterium]|nr:DinB family protein [Terriglobales bacterium]
MKKSSFLLLAVLGLCGLGLAQSKDEPTTVTSVLDGTVKTIESELVPAVEAMPEDKFSYAPTNGEFKGVRTFAQQAKHIAAVNYIVAAAILGEKPPVETGGESGPDSVKSKADIVKYLKDSYTYVHKAVGTVNAENAVAPIKNPFGEGTATRLGMATVFAWHGFDHYGQIVVYLRSNGIVPPASR